MKKYLFFICLLPALILLAVDKAAAQLDSAAIQNALQTGADIATAIKPQWINGISNEVVSSIVTIIAGLIIRFFEKRKMRKNLIDKGNL